MKSLWNYLSTNNQSSFEESASRRIQLLEYLKEFVLIWSRKEDEVKEAQLSLLLPLIHSKVVFDGEPILALYILRSLSILARAKSNRVQFNSSSVSAIVQCLYSSSDKIQISAIGLLRNLCRDDDFVEIVIQQGAIKSLLNILTSKNSPTAREGAAATLQSVSYRVHGRKVLVELGGLSSAMKVFECNIPRLRMRALAILQNLTVDPSVVFQIRDSGLIPKLEQMLDSSIEEEAGYAAGTIQNLAREPKSRAILMETKAVSRLSKIAFSSTHVPAQTSAICAMCNILMPQQGSGFKGFQRRRLLKEALSDALFFSLTASALLESKEWKSFASSATLSALENPEAKQSEKLKKNLKNSPKQN